MSGFTQSAAMVAILLAASGFTGIFSAQVFGGQRPSARELLKGQAQVQSDIGTITNDIKKFGEETDQYGDPTPGAVTEDDSEHVVIMGVVMERPEGTRKWYNLRNEKDKLRDKLDKEIQPQVNACNQRIEGYRNEMKNCSKRISEYHKQLDTLKGPENTDTINMLWRKIQEDERNQDELCRKIDEEQSKIDQMYKNNANSPGIKDYDKQMEEEKQRAKQNGTWNK